MKIVSWNCNNAFRNKWDLIAEFAPDIAVIAESESPDYLQKQGNTAPIGTHFWIGDHPAKGLSVFVHEEYHTRIAPFYSPEFRHILPLIITKGRNSFLLLAVWTKGDTDTYNGYVVQACKALEYYEAYLDKKTLIIGDFNSNKNWDTHFKRRYNHSHLLDFLSTHNYCSLYHTESGEEQGCETTPTIYMHKNPASPYHIDFAFVHHSRLNKIRSFTIGTYDNWIKASDHMPLFLELDLI